MKMSRLTVLVLVLALSASACTLFESGSTTTTPASSSETQPGEPGTTATNAPARPEVDITDCDDPTDGFALFCEAYDTLVLTYVDQLDDAQLAAGAERGLTEYGGDSASQPDGVIECSVPTDEFSDVCETFAAVQTSEGGTDESLVEAAIRGMLDFGVADPNTNYLNPEINERFNQDNSGQVEGIGALVNSRNLTNEEEFCAVLSPTCKLEIVSPLEGSPAEAAEIRAGDFIIRVDNDSVDGLTVDEAVSIVRGPAGTDVLLGIERDDAELEVPVTRAAIEVPVVSSEMLTDSVGYLRLSQFTFNSAEPFREALGGLLDQGMDTLILDLQGNPGGSLDAAIDMASEFLDGGIVVRTEAPDQDIDYEVRAGGLAADGSLEVYILINRGSASASEVLAGALADNDRATLVGENSFGKNTVQRQYDLANGGSLKVTIARWVTPDGHDFGGDGIAPDIAIPYPEEPELDFLRDETLELIEANG